MKKKFLTLATYLVAEKMEMEAFEALDSNEQAKIANIINANNAEYAKQQEEAGAEVAEMAKITKDIADETAKQVTLILKSVATMQEKMVAQSKGNAEPTKTTLKSEIAENKEALKSLLKVGGNEVEIKAVTNRASVSNNALGVFIPEITQLGHKERSLYNVLPKINVTDSNTGGVIRYRDWDEATTVRAAAMIAESGTFPESTAKFKWYSEDLRKVGDTLPVTEEFFEDEAQAASELEMFLKINVSLVIDNQLVTGDGTGQNLKGLFLTSTAYVPVASSIPAPNLKDLAIKVKNDITRTRGSKYKPDMMLVNSLTMEGLVLAKDANNNYIFNEDTGTVAGLAVVVDENVADNEMLIGDRMYARIYERTGLAVTKGMPNAQFLEDELTIKVRKRMLLLVKNGDISGFRKVTSISAALATLAL